MGSTSTTILILSLFELLVGLTKTPVAVSLSADNSGISKSIILFALAVESALCIAANVIAVLAVSRYGETNLEWKLLTIAAVTDLLLLFIEGRLAFIIGLQKKDGVGATIKSRLKEFAALVFLSIFFLPLIVLFFRTKDRGDLYFTNIVEKYLVIAQIASTLVCVLFFLFLCLISCKNTLPFFILLFVPLLTSCGFAVVGAFTQDSAILLSALLVLFPPTASTCFIFVKTKIMDDLWEENLRRQNSHVYQEGIC